MGSSSSSPRSIARSGKGTASAGLPACLISLICLLLSLTASAQTPKPSPKGKSPQQQEQAFQKHFDAARTFQIGGDQEHAATEYKAFLGEALRRIATLRARLGKYDEAEKLLQAGLSVAPDNPELRLDFAAVRLDQDNFAEAKAEAEKALQADPKNARAQYLLGNALFQQGDYRAAKDHLEAAVVGAPNFETGYLLGVTYLKLNDETRADLLFNEMVSGLGDTAKIHVYLGRAYRDGGFPERAVQELKKAVARDAKAPQVHYFLGLAYLGRDGDSGFPEAVPEFRDELKNNPNDYRTHYLLGYILLKQRNLEEAETELKRAAELDPRSPDPLLYLGQLYSDTVRQAQAEETLRKAIALTDDVSRNDYQINRAHYLLGRILLQTGRKEEGQQELQKSEELRKQAMQVARKRNAGDSPNLTNEDQPGRQKPAPASSPEEVKTVEAYVDQLKPEIADSYNNLGVIAAGSKDFKTALEYFRKAGEWQPSLETLDRNLGMAAFYADQFDQAAEPLGRHLQAQPDDTRARAALALSLFALQKYGPVRETLKPIQSEVDADPGLSYAYAVSLVKTGDYTQGIDRLKALEKANPNNADIHSLLGQAFADQSEWGAALDEYRKAVAIDPKQARTHFLAGLALIRQGNPADAAQEMRAALEIDPSDVASKYHLAFALIQMEKKDEALPLLREVLQQDPKYADAYYQLGKLQLERGETKAAISNLEAGTKFNPDGDYIHYQLALAYRRDSRTEDAEREMKVYQALKNRHRGRNAPQSN
jgi:tetratricopeptide (TPR) repeat protein